jgi:hypothetical protein
MISLERFEEKLIWLVDVTGLAVKKASVRALWEELKEESPVDFEEAVKAISYKDEKINLANLSRHIAFYRMKRIEREAVEKQAEEDRQTRLWFSRHAGSRDECINDGNCGKCAREYCDIVSKAAIEAIKKMIVGDLIGEEAHKELASKFRGIGFEEHILGLEPF